MRELDDQEVKAGFAVMRAEDTLDQLIAGFKTLRAHDRAEGYTEDDGALGGRLMVVDEHVKPHQLKTLLALAIRRAVDLEVPDASS